MQTEIEAKFPGIDPEGLRQALRAAGATLDHAERLMRRKNFDYPDRSLEARRGWVRVRDEGGRVTLAYKQLDDRTLHGTKEVSLAVEDSDRAVRFLEAVGFKQTSYQETKRETWTLGEVEVAIDTWPWVPSFAELEGPTEGAVRSAAERLGFTWSEAMHGSVENIYQLYYDVTELEVDGWPEILFTAVPEALERKRRRAA